MTEMRGASLENLMADLGLGYALGSGWDGYVLGDRQGDGSWFLGQPKNLLWQNQNSRLKLPAIRRSAQGCGLCNAGGADDGL